MSGVNRTVYATPNPFTFNPMPTPELLLATFIQLVNDSLDDFARAQVHNGAELDQFTDSNDLIAEAYERAAGHPMNFMSTDQPLLQLLNQTFEAAAAQNYIL
jgi:hypothetical protein